MTVPFYSHLYKKLRKQIQNAHIQHIDLFLAIHGVYVIYECFKILIKRFMIFKN